MQGDLSVEKARHENTRLAVAEATEQLALLDQAVLSKAFRGELVPQDPDDEPASALLERIRAERSSTNGTAPHAPASRAHRPRRLGGLDAYRRRPGRSSLGRHLRRSKGPPTASNSCLG